MSEDRHIPNKVDQIIKELRKLGYTESENARDFEDFEGQHGGVRAHLEGGGTGLTVYRDGTVLGDRGVGQIMDGRIYWHNKDSKEFPLKKK